MVPTVLVGDYVFASKFAYGYSRFSLPFSPPLFPGRILAAEPKRGDVVVFRLPKDERTDYVKRVVGLPGERIQMKDGLLYINAVPVAREPLADYVGDACGTGSAAMMKRWRETLPNGVSYETLDCVDNGFYDNTSVYTVPAGSLLHARRQPRQLHRQPRAVGGGLYPAREPDRPRRPDLLLARARFGWRTGEVPVGADRHRGAMRAGRATRCSCFPI